MPRCRSGSAISWRLRERRRGPAPVGRLVPSTCTSAPTAARPAVTVPDELAVAVLEELHGRVLQRAGDVREVDARGG